MKPIFVFTGEYSLSGSKVNDLDSYFSTNNLFNNKCPYCKVRCKTGDYKTWIMDEPGEYQTDRLSICLRCGWWSYENDDPNPYMVSRWSSCAILKEYAVDNLEVPINELSSYIGQNSEALAQIHPTKFEELVGSVFSSYFGYKLEYCSYGRPDLGIDLVVLNTDQDKPIAIQVKRYKNPIELGLIHQFFGALVDSGYKQGVFVTSGKYRSGAVSASDRLNARSEIKIDLVDGQKFLEYLHIYNSHSKPVYDNILEYLVKTMGRFQTKRIVENMRKASPE